MSHEKRRVFKKKASTPKNVQSSDVSFLHFAEDDFDNLKRIGYRLSSELEKGSKSNILKSYTKNR